MTALSVLARAGAGFKTIYATITGGNVAQANSLVQLGTDGFLDDSVYHPSIVPAPISLPATVAIAAGLQVNIFSSSGTESVQLADATLGLRSDGYVIAAAAQGATAKVYRRGGINTGLTGLTQDKDYFLGVAGQVTATQNATVGQIDQYIGKAINAAVLDQLPPQPVVQN